MKAARPARAVGTGTRQSRRPTAPARGNSTRAGSHGRAPRILSSQVDAA